MKFCKDCRNFIPCPMPNIPHCATCKRAPKTQPDPEFMVLGGKNPQEYGYCTTQRIGPTTPENCGVDAGWFEPFADEKELLRRDLDVSKPTFTNSDVEGHTA